MTHRQLKIGYFVVEGVNSFATCYYCSYLFFFMQRQFGFGDLQNLLLSALNGLVYMAGARLGGGFAQRHGYFRSLRLGMSVLIATLGASVMATSAAHLVAAMVLWTLGVCFLWPALEALATEGESPRGVQRMVGIYNLVWAGCAALAYFSGGALWETLGRQSIFYLPAALHTGQLALTLWLASQARRQASPTAAAISKLPAVVGALAHPPEKATTFLRLAWLANPFSYMAINTIVALIPGLASRHDLSPTGAGFFCSIWFFARLGAFLVLWLWPGWHYRFRWLLAAFALLIASFATLLLAPTLWLVCAAQVGFGLAAGLIYYSSLYYSMDAGDTKGEHGGIHESAIGVGLFAGPAVGAAALHFAKAHPSAGPLAVSALLLAGLAGFIWVRLRAKI